MAVSSNRILVATADLATRRVFLEEADCAGIDVAVAEDGATALEWIGLAFAMPGVLGLSVLDARLPGYSGVALAGAIRSNGLAVPVALLVPPGSGPGKETLRRLDVHDVMPTPPDRERVQALLSRLAHRPPLRAVAPPSRLSLGAA